MKNIKIWYGTLFLVVAIGVIYLITQAKSLIFLVLLEETELIGNSPIVVNIPIGNNILWSVIFTLIFGTAILFFFTNFFIIKINEKKLIRISYENHWYYYPRVSNIRLLMGSILDSILWFMLGFFIMVIVFKELPIIFIPIIAYIFGSIKFFWEMSEKETWEDHCYPLKFRVSRSIAYLLKIRVIVLTLVGLTLGLTQYNFTEKLIVIILGLIAIGLFLITQRFYRLIILFMKNNFIYYNDWTWLNKYLMPAEYEDARTILSIFALSFLVGLIITPFYFIFG